MQRAKWTEDKIQRWVAEGRGQGAGPHYKPWLTVHDVPAQGRRHRPFSQKFGREFQLFSDVEFGVFLLAEYSPWVVEAEEQRPIDRALSLDLASRLGIPHPYYPGYPGKGVPTVLTVDLLVTVDRGGRRTKIGIDAKTRDQLDKPKVLRKLQLTKRCLAEESYDHTVVCDTHLPKQLINNLVWLRSALPHKGELLPYPDQLEEAADRLLDYLPSQLATSKRLQSVCDELDRLIGWEPATALRAARILLHTHRLYTDLHQPDIPGLPMGQFRLPEPAATAFQAGAA